MYAVIRIARKDTVFELSFALFPAELAALVVTVSQDGTASRSLRRAWMRTGSEAFLEDSVSQKIAGVDVVRRVREAGYSHLTFPGSSDNGANDLAISENSHSTRDSLSDAVFRAPI